MAEPLYYAACPDCIQHERADADCWLCTGQLVYAVVTPEKADVVLRVEFHGSAMTWSGEMTPRLRARLERLKRDPDE